MTQKLSNDLNENKIQCLASSQVLPGIPRRMKILLIIRKKKQSIEADAAVA